MFLIIAMRHRLVKSPEGKLFYPADFLSLAFRAVFTDGKSAYSHGFESNYGCDTPQDPNGPPMQGEDEKEKEITIMSSKNSNKLNVPQARAAMDKFKMEAASDLRVPPPS